MDQLKQTDLFKASKSDELKAKIENFSFQSRDNTAKYKEMKNSTDRDVA